MDDRRRSPDADDDAADRGGGQAPATPLWVKVFGVVGLLLIVLLAILLLTGGEHGPGRHAPPADGGGPVPFATA